MFWRWLTHLFQPNGISMVEDEEFLNGHFRKLGSFFQSLDEFTAIILNLKSLNG
jgi:hypothetical protein